MTERNTAEMRVCHGEEGRRKKEEVPRTAFCTRLQRSEETPVASEGRSVKDAVLGQGDGKDARMLPKAS